MRKKNWIFFSAISVMTERNERLKDDRNDWDRMSKKTKRTKNDYTHIHMEYNEIKLISSVPLRIYKCIRYLLCYCWKITSSSSSSFCCFSIFVWTDRADLHKKEVREIIESKMKKRKKKHPNQNEKKKKKFDEKRKTWLCKSCP